MCVFYVFVTITETLGSDLSEANNLVAVEFPSDAGSFLKAASCLRLPRLIFGFTYETTK